MDKDKATVFAAASPNRVVCVALYSPTQWHIISQFQDVAQIQDADVDVDVDEEDEDKEEGMGEESSPPSNRFNA